MSARNPGGRPLRRQPIAREVEAGVSTDGPTPDANAGRRTARRKGGWLSLLADLTRARVTVAVTMTSATGYLAAAGRLEWAMWVPVCGVFLLASGSSALNQVQEARTDGLMARTKSRPIPAGHMDRSTAFFIAGLLVLHIRQAEYNLVRSLFRRNTPGNSCLQKRGALSHVFGMVATERTDSPHRTSIVLTSGELKMTPTA